MYSSTLRTGHDGTLHITRPFGALEIPVVVPAGFAWIAGTRPSRPMERSMKQDAHAEDARRGLHLDRPGPHGGATISVVNTAQPGRDHETVDLLIAELNHRIRNLLVMVQALIRQTYSPTVEGYRDKLIARISNLSDAQELIGSANGKPVALAKLLEQTLRPCGAAFEKRLHAAGPEVVIGPRLALALHLVFHELATNAGKHGAFSFPFGRVKIRWDLLPADGRTARKLAILWREHDGPQVNEPRRKGFGLSLITGALTPGRVEASFEPTGVVCRILVDVSPSGESGRERLGEMIGFDRNGAVGPRRHADHRDRRCDQ